MRRHGSRLFLIGLIGIAITGFAAGLRKTNFGKQVLRRAPARPYVTAPNPINLSKAPTQVDPYSVRVISPRDALFDSVLDSAYPELRLDPSFPLLRRNTALISNESGQNIYAVT